MLCLISLALCLHGVYAIPAPRPVPALKVAEAEHVLDLKRVGSKPPSSKALLLEAAVDIDSLNSVEEGNAYGIEVGLSGDTYDVLFDTGSSDLWVFREGVECVNSKGIPIPNSKCAFGPEFPGEPAEGSIDDENFLATYGSGEVLIGTLGYEKVTVAGISVDKQEMGFVDVAYWLSGDGKLSGIFGFARTALTSAFPGTDPSKDSPSNVIHYTSFIDNAVDEGKIDNSLFSVALERGGTGQLALGGLPTIDFDQDFTTVPIQKGEISSQLSGSSNYSYYAINADGFVIGDDSSSSSFPAIVDTGTTLVYLPDSLAEQINNAYDPPSQLVRSEGGYVTECGATPPKLAFTVGGTDFVINSKDLILTEPGSGGCFSGIQPSGMSAAIFGEVFLKNVVAVYDLGNEEMRFAPHVNY